MSKTIWVYYLGIGVIISLFLFVLFDLYKLRGVRDLGAKKDVKENIRFKLEIFGFILTVVAILSALYTIQQTNESLQKTDTALTLTKNSMASQDSVTRFQDSIAKLNIFMLESISKSSYSLNKSVDSITGKLTKLPNQIDNISKSIISLNQIAIEEKLKYQKEIMGKPDLTVTSDCYFSEDRIALDAIVFYNNGDKDAEITSILFKVPYGLGGIAFARKPDRVYDADYRRQFVFNFANDIITVKKKLKTRFYVHNVAFDIREIIYVNYVIDYRTIDGEQPQLVDSVVLCNNITIHD